LQWRLGPPLALALALALLLGIQTASPPWRAARDLILDKEQELALVHIVSREVLAALFKA
jgi:hypothetical protein